MPLYGYRCDACGHQLETQQRGDRVRCPNCGLSARRVFSFRIGEGEAGGHFNLAAGRYVSNEAELREHFKKVSEKQSTETGMDVDIQPVDYRDREAYGIPADAVAIGEEEHARNREREEREKRGAA